MKIEKKKSHFATFLHRKQKFVSQIDFSQFLSPNVEQITIKKFRGIPWKPKTTQNFEF